MAEIVYAKFFNPLKSETSRDRKVPPDNKPITGKQASGKSRLFSCVVSDLLTFQV